MIDKRELKQGYKSIFERLNYSTAGHITFNMGKKDEPFVKDKLLGLWKMYYRQELGRKWHNKTDKHIKWIAITEHGKNGNNTHLHLLLNLNLSNKDLKKLENILNKIWNKRVPRGDILLVNMTGFFNRFLIGIKYIKDFMNFILSGGKVKMKRYRTHKEIMNWYLSKEIKPNKDVDFYTEKDLLE